MAGNCKPDNMRGQVKITIDVLHCNYNLNIPKDMLINGELSTGIYNNAALLDTYRGVDYFIFSIKSKCNIWAITGYYNDSGGSPNKPIRLYRKNSNGFFAVLGTYPTVSNSRGYGKWYKLLDSLNAGTYKVEATDRYSGFQELYGEPHTNRLYITSNAREVFGMSENIFKKLAEDWTALTAAEKKALFESTNYETASVDDLATLGKFKVLTYSEMDDKPEITVIAAPKDQLILPKGFISIEKFDGIDKTTLTDTVSGGGAYKLIITTDMKIYQTFDFETQDWKTVDHTDLAIVKSAGIDAAQFANITRAAWNTLLKGKVGLGIAYLIGIEATADKCAVDKLAAQVDMKGIWVK